MPPARNRQSPAPPPDPVTLDESPAARADIGASDVYDIVPAPVLTERRQPTLALAPDATVAQWHHNYDLTTPEGKAGLINAANVADWIPSDPHGVTLLCTHYVVFPDEFTDRQTGEIVQCTAVVLVARTGKTARFRAEWNLRRLHALMLLYTPEQWARGITIECYAGRSRREGQQFGSFRVIASPVSDTEEAS